MSTPPPAPGPWGPQGTPGTPGMPGMPEPSQQPHPGAPRPASSGGRGNCPDCGRPVPPYDVKLCPSCGYPLLLQREQPTEAEPQKHVYKPESATEDLDRSGVRQPTPTASYTARQPSWTSPPAQTATIGPHCPQCRTVNPAHRKRCEICGYELWPGAASPPRWQPDPPPVPMAPPRRRNRWRWLLVIGAPVTVMAAVWVLALVL
ncbi:zinc-ribbon domain-containing protein [Catenulispora rubra]|uniref:zinc-ribbon domain-containing protein n=1 Tax=Catenulispora rubra TaxID=280293 RepID=UPI0018924D34|nr:zinc-ribbon domain-containing protein [Catenulispora rubra]